MANALGFAGQQALGLLRYFTIKDRRGQPRWLWSVMLVAVIGALIAAAFAAGVLFRATSSFERLKTSVQMVLAGETVDPVEIWDRADDNQYAIRWRPLETNNKTLEKVSIPIGNFQGSGGAIFEIGRPGEGEHLAFVTPKGRIGFLAHIDNPDPIEITYLDTRVPMRLAAFEASPLAELPTFNRNWIRTMDAVVRPIGDNHFELYVSHHAYVDECFAFTISRTLVRGTRETIELASSDWDTVFRASPCPEMKSTGNLYSGLRDGGRMAWQPDGKLLITVGDFDFDGDNSPITAPMDPDYDFGKIHEIDVDAGTSEVFAIGMRNAQGLHVMQDGLIFTSEHGPNGGDEINLIERGANYGWPEVTLGMGYGFPRRPWPASPAQGRHDVDAYRAPVHAFVPSIGIGAIMEVTSPLFPDWNGDILVNSLENQALYRLRRQGDQIIYAERTQMDERLRDSLQLANGQIALLTDSARIILLRPRPPLSEAVTTENERELLIAGFDDVRAITAEQAAESARLPIHPGRVVFNSKCATCHAIYSRDIVAGPHLYRLAGRQVGSVDGYPYSDALSNRNAKWTEQRLRRFLSDPDAEFAGSAMARVPLTYPEYLHVAWWITNCTGGRDRPECHTNG